MTLGHSESRVCKKHVRLLQRRKSLLEEVRSQNKSAHLITVGYVGAGYTSIVLGNDRVPLKLQRIVLLRLCEGVTKRKLKKILNLPFRQQKISQVGFVRFAVKRLEAPGLNCFLLLKPAFKKASTKMIGFGLKECPHHLMVPRQGNAIAETLASLIAST